LYFTLIGYQKGFPSKIWMQQKPRKLGNPPRLGFVKKLSSEEVASVDASQLSSLAQLQVKRRRRG
jgi:hypothetical protein